MKKYLSFTFLSISLLSGCSAFNYSAPLYKDPVGEKSNLARIRFIGNVTGTSISTKENTADQQLVPHTSFGYYNDTRDIGMPKISYRQNDYKNYYFEVYAKPGQTIFHILTDDTDQGSCSTSALVNLEAGKDYDVNFDAHEQFTKCVFHFSEIVTDPATGVKILKAKPFKMGSYFATEFN
ncbi:hypothetical protein [Pantoea vagans]|uniref:hypothetical protein n=1 Tax=Pantoea vagans TaxID=470934 RepID=UPI0028998917|nr:hypothetical protein [Pantoea vagans]